ncbi:hypothetical protein IT412_03825 [Candidatus Peregrinibacteria bacterium]|nr:hypothetical protein [Candidatus Peregrinibacteria bacterium]
MQNKPLACVSIHHNEQDEVTEIEMSAGYLESLARRRGGVFEILYRFVQAKRDQRVDYNPYEPVFLMKEMGEYHDSRATLSDEQAQEQLDGLSDYIEEIVQKFGVIQDLQDIHLMVHEAELRAAANAAERASSGQQQSAVFS